MKSRLFLLVVVTLFAGMLLSGCGFTFIQGSGNIQREERTVSDFTAVHFPGIGEMTVVQGENEGLTIETDDNLLPYITSTVSRGTLILGFEESTFLRIPRPTQSIRYTVYVKSLTGLDMSGAGVVRAEQLSAESLELAQSGAGNITIDDLTVETLTVNMSGAGNVNLAGEATRQTVEMSGLGNYEAENLLSQSATLDLSGAGAAIVWVQESLNANLSGAGSIRYYGSPQTNTSISGLGSVQSLGEK